MQIRYDVGFAFEGSNVLNALARKGIEVYRVRIDIGEGEGNPAAHAEARIPAHWRTPARPADPR